ncbi:MAG: hypothetical protein AAB439_00525 [Patescibacteria group bacterium]
MPTLKKRINISVSKDVERAIEKLARRDNVPDATKAADLIQIALEIDEDEVLNAVASTRDTKSATFVSHKKAWA